MANATNVFERKQEETQGEMWTPPGRERWTAVEGKAMAEAFRQSGLSRREFAEKHGVGKWRVHRWTEGDAQTPRSPTRRDATAVRFAPVRVKERPRSATVEVAIGQAIVRVGADFDEDLLRRVVAVLGGQGC